MTIHHRCGLAALLALLTLPSSAVTPATSAASTLPATPALPGPVAARQFILVDQATGRRLAAQG